jgi:serine/threonine protein kinase
VTDFGLSVILAECDSSSCESYYPGSIRWAAPELINLTDEEAGKPTTCSDVYSLGSVILQVNRPYFALWYLHFELQFRYYQESSLIIGWKTHSISWLLDTRVCNPWQQTVQLTSATYPFSKNAGRGPLTDQRLTTF